jgi:hypothetical protein
LKYSTKIRAVTVAMLAIALFSTYGAFAQTETLLHTFTGGSDEALSSTTSAVMPEIWSLVPVETSTAPRSSAAPLKLFATTTVAV